MVRMLILYIVGKDAEKASAELVRLFVLGLALV